MDDKVAIIMGSISDRETMEKAAEVLNELGISYEMKVLSAHRTPDLLFEYVAQVEEEGFKVIIAGAGGAAHLPGVKVWCLAQNLSLRRKLWLISESWLREEELICRQ